ncbi:MAG: hypothetical protein C4521_06045 [Actinobacteria bacterium]|nr:MAG: hypothetical protein C4521_06045 [Actinomycetota bacterium]
MRRLLALFAILVLLITPGTAAGQAKRHPEGQVVIVLLSNLSVAEVRTGPTPFLRELGRDSSVGLVNTIGVGRAAIDRSAVTIGAGARAQMGPDVDPPMNVREPYEGGEAWAAYRRRAGRSARGYQVADIGYPGLYRDNSLLPYHMTPGAVGEAVEAAGGRSAVFGNADVSLDRRDRASLHREGVYVAMNAKGLVHYGDVGRATVRRDRNAPFGLATEESALVEGYARVRDKAHLVVLDFGDLTRAELFRPFVSSKVAGRQRRVALAAADRFVRRLVPLLRPDATLMIVSPVGPEDGGANSLNPIVVRGPSFGGGLLTSPVTHRPGLVNATDIAPTVLETLGLEPSQEFLGARMRSVEGGSLARRLEHLQALHSRTSTEVTLRTPVMSAFTVLIVLIFAGVTAVLFMPSLASRVAVASRWLLLAVVSTPLAAYLMWLLWPPAAHPLVLILTFVALALLIPTIALLASHGGIGAVVKVCLATIVFISVDQLFASGRLCMSTFFGYSPIHAARYYGLGNEGWAILVGALLVATSLLLDRESLSPAAFRWGVPLVFGSAVFMVAFPTLGANIGAIPGITAGLAAGYIQMRAGKIGVKQVAVIAGVIVLVFAAFTLYDAARPPEAATHIGRSARLITGENGRAELFLLLYRKAHSNIKVMAKMQWSYVLLLILAVLAMLRVKPRGLFAETLRRRPGIAAATTGGLVGGAVGFLTEDSGVVIPALIMMFVGAAILFAMVDTKQELQAERPG